MLRTIDEPISVRLYFSKRLGEAAPVYARYFERVRALLRAVQRHLRRQAGGCSSSIPSRSRMPRTSAVAAGLRGIRLNQEGEPGYFGLVGSNSTDNDATIAFFTTDREAFLEYDVTKLVYTLANPKKRVVGMISSLPLDGGHDPMAMMGMRPAAMPPQMVMEQIREFFEVKTLDAGRQGDPGRRRRADAGAARRADARGRLRHRPVRAGRRQGAGVRRSGGGDRPRAAPDGHAGMPPEHRRDR